MRKEEKERRDKRTEGKETENKEKKRKIKREEGSIHSLTPYREWSRVPSNHYTKVQLDNQIHFLRPHMGTELAPRCLYHHKNPTHSCGLTRAAPWSSAWSRCICPGQGILLQAMKLIRKSPPPAVVCCFCYLFSFRNCWRLPIWTVSFCVSLASTFLPRGKVST